MNKNIEAIEQACKEKGVLYSVHHDTGNLISIEINNSKHMFVNWTTPLNPQSIMQLCQDKDYFYSFYKNIIKMPKTSSFLNPYSDEKYSKYLKLKTIFEIIKSIEQDHNYPIIIKKNRGSWGANVFKVNDTRELEKGLLKIFNMNSASFDYVCLAQEFIEIKQEYRVIYLNGEHQFSYKKVIDDALFSNNLSPLHWEGSKSELVRDNETLKHIINFCSPIFDELMIPFCGLDVALDNTGKFWLIEANSSPGFDHIIEHQGNKEIVTLYKKMIAYLTEKKANK